MAQILVVVAHPDDEVLGCGGTIPLLARAGHEVTIAILGEGETSRHAQPGAADTAKLKALRVDARAAAVLVEAVAVVFESLPDNRFDTLPLLDVVKVVEKLVHRVKPSIIYTHHGGDLNVDHSVVSRAVLTATRPAPGMPVEEVYACEVPSSSEWSFGTVSSVFRPNVFYDISATLSLKTAAMNAYRSEVRPFPHPRSAQALEAIAQRWGTVVGCHAAEAFELIRSVRRLPPIN